jgi:hypothetical protein
MVRCRTACIGDGSGEVRDYGNIGQEPVRHVRNIYNYYIAYNLPEEYRHATETIKQTGTIHP